MRPTINTEKHVVHSVFAVATTNVAKVIAKAVTAPSNTVDSDCHRGGHVKAIWVSLDFCGLAGTGVHQRTVFYLIKNPGDNLTEPGALAVGTSNEKKFVFKQWSAMTMRNQEGNPPYHWEGWVKVPRLYQRMGADDTIMLVGGCNTSTGHGWSTCIYKEQF